MEEKPRILSAGDQAILIEFGKQIAPEVNRRVQAFAGKAVQKKIPGVGELVPSYCTLLIYFDPFLLTFEQISDWAQGLLTTRLEGEDSPSKVKEIPVLYGGEYGPDLSFVADYNRIRAGEVIRLHSGEVYRVYVVGFSPGFAAMGSVPQEIQAPRLPNPRTKVPAGSVGIGGKQTGIYAMESPGGWQLIGRTPLTLFDLEKNPPSFFQAGDDCRFYAITEEQFLNWK